MVFWHHLYQILSLKQTSAKQKMFCSKTQTDTSIIHIVHGVLDEKRGLF